MRATRTAIAHNVVNDHHGEAEGGGIYVDEGSKKTVLTRSTVIGNAATGAHPHGGRIFVNGGAPVKLVKR